MINVMSPPEITTMILMDHLKVDEQYVAQQVCKFWMNVLPPKPNVQMILLYALKKGHTHIVKYIMDKEIVASNAKNPTTNQAEQRRNSGKDYFMLYVAALHNKCKQNVMGMITLLNKELGCSLTIMNIGRVQREAIEKGLVDVLHWLKYVKHMWATDHNMWMCQLAAGSGQLETLKWLKIFGACGWDVWTCSAAASNGHLAVLQWARSHGCRWHQKTSEEAAKNGHLELLQWARSHGCPWNVHACAKAAGNGQLETLKWARENGCPWDASTCSLHTSKPFFACFLNFDAYWMRPPESAALI